MFKPKKKDTFTTKIKDYLMKGYIIRVNGIDTLPLEVVDRKFVPILGDTGNIGGGSVDAVDKINCAHSVFYEVKAELSKEYSIREVDCKGSGCCQYHTKGFYLD